MDDQYNRISSTSVTFRSGWSDKLPDAMTPMGERPPEKSGGPRGMARSQGKLNGTMILLPSHSPSQKKDHAMGAARREPRGGKRTCDTSTGCGLRCSLSIRDAGGKYDRLRNEQNVFSMKTMWLEGYPSSHILLY